MANDRRVLDSAPATDASTDFYSVLDRVLAGAAERIHSSVERAKQLGIIDEHGNITSKEWPAEMQPLPVSAVPLDLDDYDWRF